MDESSLAARLLALCAIGLLSACGESAPPAAVAPASGPRNDATYAFSAKGMDDKDARLIAAAGRGDLAAVIVAIEEGANAHATDRLKRNAVFVAALTNRPPVIRELAERGVRIDGRDASGMAPLHAAVAMGSREALLAMIDLRADVNVTDVSGRTPLHIAAATNQTALVELLLARGANAKLQDKHGMTAAALARDCGHAKVADLLQSRARS
jgi:ankyrin repeat protein